MTLNVTDSNHIWMIKENAFQLMKIIFAKKTIFKPNTNKNTSTCSHRLIGSSIMCWHHEHSTIEIDTNTGGNEKLWMKIFEFREEKKIEQFYEIKLLKSRFKLKGNEQTDGQIDGQPLVVGYFPLTLPQYKG